LLRRNRPMGRGIFYYEERSGEADFLVCDGNTVKEIYQVCYDMRDPKTRKREIGGLLLAHKATKCDKLYVVTHYDWEDVEKDGLTIHVVPAAEWFAVNV